VIAANAEQQFAEKLHAYTLPPTDWETPFNTLATECDVEMSMLEAVQYIQKYVATKNTRVT
jgi:hypothetical protein